MERTLVLTATITPPVDAHKLARSDPGLRRQDYYSAFSKYLEQPDIHFDRLIFAENSGSNLSEFQDLASGITAGPKIEIWQFNSNDFPSNWGRAYGEFKLLDLVFDRLAPGPDDQFWKATGRVFVENLKDIAENSPRSFDLYCDCRYIPRLPGVWEGKRWMDMRIIGFGSEFYKKEIRGLGEDLKHELTGTPEPYFFERVVQWKKQYEVKCRFNRQPILRGFAGYDNKDLSSFRQKALTNLRRFTRRFTPCLWI